MRESIITVDTSSNKLNGSKGVPHATNGADEEMHDEEEKIASDENAEYIKS